MEAQTVIHDSASEVTLLLSGGKKRVKHYNVEIILFLMCIGYQLFGKYVNYIVFFLTEDY